jgi:plasmid segregation protein ParM
MSKNRLIVMGIDHGNGYFKGYSNDSIKLVLPSGFLTKESVRKENSTGVSETNYNKFASGLYEDELYVWGTDVNKERGKFLSTYTSEDRYSQKYYKLLSQFGFASLIKNIEGTFEVLVVTGCPSREKGTKREDALSEAFSGEHVVRMNDRQKVIRVKECKILSQPLGTILDLYIDDHGNIQKDEIANSYIGIVDIGSGTIDCDGIDCLKAIPDDRHTIPIGVHEVYQRLADYINTQNPDANATPRSVELQFTSDLYHTSKRLVIPIKEAKERIVRETAEYIINDLQTRWRNRSKFDMVILTGGGAKLFEPWFRNFINDIHVIEDYQVANARGFFKFGLLLAKDYEAEDESKNRLVGAGAKK